MKLKIIGLFTCALFLLGCGPKAPEPNTSLTLKQLMEWVIDTNADLIWDSVKSISNAKGTTEIYPRTDAQWEAVRNSAATLVEAGNSLMIEGRAKDTQQWMKFAKQLSQSAELALKAAQNKNKDALFDAGGEIYSACKSCHDKYADFDKPSSK
ncbi:cytochrome c [Polynucleobacter sp. UK-Kesae-W10]|uniref:cytochrome c n=1 Tax=Polynucleobacter sp. UK-Kesae-W10 TaxID=1819738 RepID=UPI001C0B0719|nr:cytochrome c [Polynucleobacter sp. UK-Kesae-W10]MBU3576588.1 cytochrome c [Polynucleobacter sp. UK-Kesae-W10]